MHHLGALKRQYENKILVHFASIDDLMMMMIMAAAVVVVVVMAVFVLLVMIFQLLMMIVSHFDVAFDTFASNQKKKRTIFGKRQLPSQIILLESNLSNHDKMETPARQIFKL